MLHIMGFYAFFRKGVDTVYEVFEKLLEINDISVTDVVNATGVSYSTISNWKKRRNQLSAKNAQKIASFLGVSIDYLMTGKESEILIDSYASSLEQIGEDFTKRMETYQTAVKHRKIPVFGKVAAGVPITAIKEILDWEEIDSSYHGEFFGLKVVGDSMSPRICEGDTLIVRSQPTIENGQIAIVQINGDQATCKKVLKHSDGISLLSLNPLYEPMVFTKEQVETLPITIIGRVVENRQKY